MLLADVMALDNSTAGAESGFHTGSRGGKGGANYTHPVGFL